MKNLTRLLHFSAVAVLAGGLLLSFPGPVRADSTGTKIAVVNTAHVFAEMQETKDLKSDLEKKRTDISAQEQDKRAQITDMQKNLREMAPDSAEYKAGQDKLDQAVADFKVWGQVTELQAERQQKAMMVTLFKKIVAATNKVAQQDNIDIVIADQAPDLSDTETPTFEQLRSLINQEDVLYSSKKSDISDQVLALLDADYAKSKASAGK